MWDNNVWEDNYRILMSYYKQNKEVHGKDKAMHWYQMQINKTYHKDMNFSEKQKDMLMDIAVWKYRISGLPDFEEVERVYKKKAGSPYARLYADEKRLYNYVYLLILFERCDNYSVQQRKRLNELLEKIKKQKKNKNTKNDALKICTDVYNRVSKGRCLLEIKRQEPELYAKYKTYKVNPKQMGPNERKRYQTMKAKIIELNREIRTSGEVINAREQHIIDTFNRVLEFYKTGGKNLYIENVRLYLQYMNYKRKMDTEKEKLQKQIDIIEKKIENLNE